MPDYTKIFVANTPQYVKVFYRNPPDYVKMFFENVIERVIVQTPFTKILSGYTDTVLQAEHGLSHVRGLRVTTPAPGEEEVEVLEKYSGTTVEIFSNVLLDGHLLTIY